MTMSGATADPEIEKYKAMIRNSTSSGLEENFQRSQEFVSPAQSPKRKVSLVGSSGSSSSTGNSPHKWGKPVSPEQFRPDGWLGSPASGAGKRGYKVKSPKKVLLLPTVDLDDNDSAIGGGGSTITTTSSASTASQRIKEANDNSRRGSNNKNGVPSAFAGSISPKQSKSAAAPYGYNKFRRHQSVGPGTSSASNAATAASEIRSNLQRRSSIDDPVLATPSPGSLRGKKKFIPSRGISEGGKPGVPSMFAASISPNAPTSFKKSPKLPDAKKFLAMRDTTYGVSQPSSPDVPAAFRRSLNNGISVASKSELVSKYGLSPGPGLSKPRKFASAYAQTSPYVEAKKISVASKSEVVSKYGLSPGPGLAKPRKFASAYAQTSPYMEAKKNLRKNKGGHSKSVTSKPGQGNPNVPGVTLTPMRRAQFEATKSQVKSASDLYTEDESPLAAARRRISMNGSSHSGTTASSSPKSKVRKSPKRSSAGSNSSNNEVNGPMPPPSQHRVSAPMELTELPGLPLDASPEPTFSSKKSMSLPPPVATSYAKEQEEEKSPILKREKIDKEKFLSSFISFEDQEGPPISSDPLKSWSPKKKSKAKKAASLYSRKAPDLYPELTKAKQENDKKSSTKKKKTTPSRATSVRSVSPKRSSHKNYSISPKARSRDSEVAMSTSNHAHSMYSMDGSSYQGWSELDDLQTIIAHLRKVQLPDISKVKKRKGADKSDEQASEILDIIRNLRRVETNDKTSANIHNLNKNNLNGNGNGDTITSTMTDLKRAGILKVKIMDIELSMLEDAQMRLKKVHRRLLENEDDDDDDLNNNNNHAQKIMTTILAKLQKAMNSNIDFLPLVEDAIINLQQMVPNLINPEDQEEVEGVITNLRGVEAKMLEREEGELAGVIRSFEDHNSKLSSSGSAAAGSIENGERELAKIISNLKSLCQKQTPLFQNLSTDDQEFLSNALKRLKATNMTDDEAAQCADLIRSLRTLGDRKAQHAAIAKLGQSMNTPENYKGNEIEAVLRGLRKLTLTDENWDELANQVANFNNKSHRRGGAPSTEMSNIIAGLRKVKMNPKQAKEVAGIVYNLRKVRRPDQGTLSEEEQERQRIKLRKVLFPNGDDGTNEDLLDMILTDLANVATSSMDDNDLTDLVDTIVDLGNHNDNDGSTIDTGLKMPELPSEPPLVLDVPSNATPGNNKNNNKDGVEALGETLHWDRGVSLSQSRNYEDSDYEEASTSSEESDGDGNSDDDDDDDDDDFEMYIEFSTGGGEGKKKKKRKKKKMKKSKKKKGQKDGDNNDNDNGTAVTPATTTSTTADGTANAAGENLKWNRSPRRSHDGEDDSDFEEASISSTESERKASGRTVDKNGLRQRRLRNNKQHKKKAKDANGDDDNSEGSIDFSDVKRGGGGMGSSASRLSHSGVGDRKFHYSCPIVYEPDRLGNTEVLPEPEEKKKKIVFNQKPKWKHKKHNMTVVGEKRWRFQESFGADAVLFSPLSRDQYDRRQKISQSLFANLGDTLPFGDDDKVKDSEEVDLGRSYTNSGVKEFMDRKERTGRRSKVVTATDDDD